MLHGGALVTAEKLHVDPSNRAEYRHTGALESRTHLAPESHDEAGPFREKRDAWVPGGCDPVCLPARANICTAGASAAGGEPSVTLGRRCGHARIESPPSGRTVLRDVPQRTSQNCGPEAGPDRRRQ